MSSEHTPTAAAEAEFYVYVHVKADTGEPFYAGKGSGHRAWSKNGRSAWWKNIVAKHGLVVRIQKHFQDESAAFASEIETIAILRDLGYELCNLTDGGEGPSGAMRGEETRAKMSAAKSTPEARAAQAEWNQRRWSKPEARLAQAERVRQRMASPEARLAVAERNRQRWSNPEERAAQSERMSGESSPTARLSDDACRTVFRLRAQGLSQDKIAAQIGCSQTHVSRILSGEFRRNIYLEFHPEQA